MEGRKQDNGKLRWDLLPFEQIESVVDVLTYGAIKYNEDPDDPNWKKVDNGKHRYFAAMMRHISAWKQGELLDQESGKCHLSHAAANLLFLMYFNKQKNER